MGKVNLSWENKANYYKSLARQYKEKQIELKKEIKSLERDIIKLHKQNLLAHEVVRNYSDNGMLAKGKIKQRWPEI